MQISRTRKPIPKSSPHKPGEPPDQIVAIPHGSPNPDGSYEKALAILRTRGVPFYKKNKKYVGGAQKIYDLAVNEYMLSVPPSVDTVISGGFVVWGAGDVADAVFDENTSAFEIVLNVVKWFADFFKFLDATGVKTINPIALKTASVVCSVVLDLIKVDEKTGQKTRETVCIKMNETDLSVIPKSTRQNAQSAAFKLAGLQMNPIAPGRKKRLETPEVSAVNGKLVFRQATSAAKRTPSGLGFRPSVSGKPITGGHLASLRHLDGSQPPLIGLSNVSLDPSLLTRYSKSSEMLQSRPISRDRSNSEQIQSVSGTDESTERNSA